MKTAVEYIIETNELITPKKADEGIQYVRSCINESWKIIAPIWPLRNIIARNPLAGLEDFQFEDALKKGVEYFQQDDIPKPLHTINRETIKWCQAFFDDGQATISMPSRHQGFYTAVRSLLVYDKNIINTNKNAVSWIESLPDDPELVIIHVLEKMRIPREKYSQLMTLLLTSLPGWAGYVRYRVDWCDINNVYTYTVNCAEYLAIRLILCHLFWDEPISVLLSDGLNSSFDLESVIQNLKTNENKYSQQLFQSLSYQLENIDKDYDLKPKDAQLVFCIDVRSEPFRRSLELQGNYETLGFAGFFGLPVSIKEFESGQTVSSCPVLLKPKHTVIQTPNCSKSAINKNVRRKNILKAFKRIYQSLKYNFTTPFVLVDIMGPIMGVHMGLRTFFPLKTQKLKKHALKLKENSLSLNMLNTSKKTDAHHDHGIDVIDQCKYAENALRMMGLTRNFSRLVVFCGHGSTTENNAHATALDCGACGGHHGGSNAQLLAEILNQTSVRHYLQNMGIVIPNTTLFLAAEHNTTTDEIKFMNTTLMEESKKAALIKLQADLDKAKKINSEWRCKNMGVYNKDIDSIKVVTKKSSDWAETRPEWGLAKNAAFIVGPRRLTKDITLDGRAFLHSYDWEQDPEGASLQTILTAPMVVAQWINTQYLFSTLDNVAFGSGSKVTQNISGKLGIIQGNASDLMHGLSLQSVNKSDKIPYHEPIRLQTVVYAPCHFVLGIVKSQDVLIQLFSNEWVFLVAIDPTDHSINRLQPDLTWKKISL